MDPMDPDQEHWREHLLLANNQSELLLIGRMANLKIEDDISDIHCHGAANIKNFQKNGAANILQHQH